MTTRRTSLIRRFPLIVFFIVLAVFSVLFVRYQRKPVITGLDRLTASAGDRIEVTGRHFGDTADSGKLLIGTQPLTSTGIVEWTDRRILARVPRHDGAVLVKVRTRSGTSRGVVLGDALRFPRVEYGPWLPGAPYLEFIEPSVSGVGGAVVLHGEGFGDRQGGGEIWVNRSDDSGLMGTEAPDLHRYIKVELIDYWTDGEVRFWLPEGSSSGNIYLFSGGFFSNPATIEVFEGPGVAEWGEQVQWSMRQDVVIRRVGAFPGNCLYLFVPFPDEAPGQSDVLVLMTSDERRALVRRSGNLDLYRLDELVSGVDRRISRQLAVTVRPFRYRMVPALQRPFDSDRPDIADALIRDRWIRPDLVAGTAKRLAGTSGDVWNRSKILYDHVRSVLIWDDEARGLEVSEYLSTGRADSRGFSFLFVSMARAAGIPSRPVGGILVLEDLSTRIWWWSEIWIEGFGWLPVDPALGSGVSELPGIPDNPGDMYFGGNDGRHIAFSRGILASGPLQPDPVNKIPDDFYSLQGSWEELSGNLESYSSEWTVPRITATYPD